MDEQFFETMVQKLTSNLTTWSVSPGVEVGHVVGLIQTYVYIVLFLMLARGVYGGES